MTLLAAIQAILKSLPEIIAFVKRAGEWFEAERNKKWFADKVKAFELLEKADDLESKDPRMARKLRIEGLRLLGDITKRV